jgi:hypothetical protein
VQWIDLLLAASCSASYHEASLSPRAAGGGESNPRAHVAEQAKFHMGSILKTEISSAKETRAKMMHDVLRVRRNGQVQKAERALNRRRCTLAFLHLVVGYRRPIVCSSCYFSLLS